MQKVKQFYKHFVLVFLCLIVVMTSATTLAKYVKEISVGSVSLDITALDTTGPDLTVTAPISDSRNAPTLTGSMDTNYIVTGKVSDPSGIARLTVNDVAVQPDANGDWSAPITLVVGETKEVNVVATDNANNSTILTRYVMAAWDVSSEKNGSVVAYVVENVENTGKYTLTITGTGAMMNWGTSAADDFHASAYKTKITSVLVGNGVTSIGDYTFNGCTALTSVTIPESVASIGIGAFNRCTYLVGVTIPESVVSIGKSCFSECSRLASITIPSGVTAIPDNAFTYCKRLTNVVLHDGITSIGYAAFASCKFTNITLPADLQTIGDRAFWGCSNLESITIPDGVTTIGLRAFYDCEGLASITIPSTVTTIGESAFPEPMVEGADGNWYSLSSGAAFAPDEIPVGVADTYVAVKPYAVTYNANGGTFSDGDATNVVYYNSEGAAIADTYEEPSALLSNTSFYQWYTTATCDPGTEYVPSAVTSDLTLYAMYDITVTADNRSAVGDTGALDLTAPVADATGSGAYYRVVGIGDSAFEDCTELTSVTIPESVTAIGSNAFYRCSSLESVSIPESVVSIGKSCFSECDSLESVTIPAGVTVIEDNTFTWCYSLENVVIPDGVTSIGYGAFISCPFTTITLPENLETIEDRAFYQTALTNVTIPEGVTSIGVRAFYGCSSLKSITIPSTVSTIGDRAFLRKTTVSSSTWYSLSTGTAYTHNEIPVGVADTYVTVKPYAVTYNANGGTFSDGEATNVIYHNSEGVAIIDSYEEPSALASDTSFYQWYTTATCDPGTEYVPSTVTSDLTLYAMYDITVTADNRSAVGDTGALDLAAPVADATGTGAYYRVVGIGDSAFKNCTALTSVTIPEGVTSIGSNAFLGCSDLESVSIPETVIAIGNGAFSDCTSLESVVIPSGVTVIEDNTFTWCNSLTNVVIPDGVTSIGYAAFAKCSFSNITLPSNLKTIGGRAFWSCDNLKGITIPAGVTSIGVRAFYECNLGDVYYLGTEEQWNAIDIDADNEDLLDRTIHYSGA